MSDIWPLRIDAKNYSFRRNRDGIAWGLIIHPSADCIAVLAAMDVGFDIHVTIEPVKATLTQSGPVRADERGLQAPSLPPQGRAAETKLTAKERYAALPPEKQAIADAAMLADDVSFQMWATERAYAMGLKFDTAKDFIHDRCAVASCSEFATDPRALQRWNGFRAVFDEWRRG